MKKKLSLDLLQVESFNLELSEHYAQTIKAGDDVPKAEKPKSYGLGFCLTVIPFVDCMEDTLDQRCKTNSLGFYYDCEEVY